MPKAWPLTTNGKGRTETYPECGWTHRLSATKIGRSQSLVSRYLKNPDLYSQKQRRGTKLKLEPADRKRICREASNTMRTSRWIKVDLPIPVTPRRIRRIINERDHLQPAKTRSAPSLWGAHINPWKSVAKDKIGQHWETWWDESTHVDRNYCGFARDFSLPQVLISDEEEFSLDDPDGFNHYLRDLRKEPMISHVVTSVEDHWCAGVFPKRWFEYTWPFLHRRWIPQRTEECSNLFNCPYWEDPACRDQLFKNITRRSMLARVPNDGWGPK